jgi:hypothetical protein
VLLIALLPLSSPPLAAATTSVGSYAAPRAAAVDGEALDVTVVDLSFLGSAAVAAGALTSVESAVEAALTGSGASRLIYVASGETSRCVTSC